MQENLPDIIQGFEHYMPPLSEPMARALEAIRAPQVDTRALSRLLMQDTILASKTFKLVNSPYFSSSSKQLASINKALISLGAMKVKNIIIALVLQKLYENEGPADLFEHSIRCATACEFLAEEYKCINPDDAFILGFLHDIGQVILKSKYGDEYIKVYNAAKGNYDVLVASEIKNFSVTHSVLGAKLCEKWCLPAILSDTLYYHHTPKMAKIPFAAGIVYIADRLISRNYETTEIDQNILDYLQVSLSNAANSRENILAKSQIFLDQLSDF